MNAFLVNSERGFSLIQVLISLVILSFIVFTTVTIVNQNQRISGALNEDFALYHEIRAAMTTLENDISLFFILDPRFDIKNKREIFDAVFVGSKQKLSAVTANYEKRVASKRDTNVREVEYVLTKDETAEEGEPAFNLMRKATSFLDEALFGPGLEYAVLTDLRSFSFTYYDEKNENWRDRWDSREEETKNKMPIAIAVKYEIYRRDPTRPDKKAEVFAFETKFLADGHIEQQRKFTLSESIGRAKGFLQQQKSSQSQSGSSGSSSSSTGGTGGTGGVSN